MDAQELALDEARSRLERADARRADLRTTTGRLYGFLGGLLAVGLGVLLSIGAAFWPWLAGAVVVGACALLCIWKARPAAWADPAVDFADQAASDFPGRLLRARIAAAEANRASLEPSRSWMNRAEWLAAGAAGVLVVGAIVVVSGSVSRTALVPFGKPLAVEDGAAEYLLTPGADDGEELVAIRNPDTGVPALVVGPSGPGATGCAQPSDTSPVLAPGTELTGDDLAAVLGESRPEAPLQIAVCVPGQRDAEGLRAVELRWSGRALD